jgi:hypothetical protein
MRTTPETTWVSFSSRPLAAAHTFNSFKIHVYLKPGSCDVRMVTCTLSITLASEATVNGSSTYKNKLSRDRSLNPDWEVFDTSITTTLRSQDIVVLAGEKLYLHFGDLGLYDYAQPIIQFGDAAHASYIETDSVEFEGQPIPELSLPMVMFTVSLLLVFAFVRSDRRLAICKSLS